MVFLAARSKKMTCHRQPDIWLRFLKEARFAISPMLATSISHGRIFISTSRRVISRIRIRTESWLFPIGSMSPMPAPIRSTWCARTDRTRFSRSFTTTSLLMRHLRVSPKDRMGHFISERWHWSIAWCSAHQPLCIASTPALLIQAISARS